MTTKIAFSAKTLSVLTLILVNSAFADTETKAPAYSGWSWSGHVSTLNIDSKVAKQQGIEDSAWTLGFAAERYSSESILTFALGAEFIGYSDNYSFSQETNKGNKSSDASGALVYAEFGPRIHFGQDDNNYFVAHAGVSGMLMSERGIDYCSNCYSEDIDVEGGVYGLLGVGHTFGSMDVGLEFQQYMTGDLDNSLRLRVASSF